MAEPSSLWRYRVAAIAQLRKGNVQNDHNSRKTGDVLQLKGDTLHPAAST